MPKHHETKVVPYTPEQLFNLVADIESYPQFLPWCMGAEIRDRDGQVVTADLIIGYKAFREKFTSVVELKPHEEIRVKYISGPLSNLHNQWKFLRHHDGCTLDFEVEFGFRSPFLGFIMDQFFDVAFRRMVSAFEARAKVLYG